MVDWRAEFVEAILRICSYTALDDKFPKEYLPGVFLLPKEMHMLEIILHHPRLNATEYHPPKLPLLYSLHRLR